MGSATKKRGRKEKPHRLSDGTYINGLRKRKNDGRWVVVSTGKMFTEPDERKAVAHFRKLMGEKQFEGTGLSAEEIEWLQTPAVEIVDRNAATALSRGFVLVGPTDEAWKKFWHYVAEQIRTRRKWVAEQTGIEEIGYFQKVKPAEKLPTLDVIKSTWMTHAKCSPAQRRKTLTAWQDFIATTGIGSIDEITPQLVVEYQDDVYDRIVTPRGGEEGPISGKQQQHLFTGIRTILRFIKNRAMAIEATSKVLDYLSILKPSQTTVSIDPKPISVAEWKSLLKKATGDDLVLVLLMLNCAMYIREAIRLRWDEIKADGTIVTNRKKTGKIIRVAVLWDETLDALKSVKRKGDFIFYNYAGVPLGISGAQMRFNNLAADAECAHVTGSQLRDGAYTAAVAANVSEQLTRLLVGHRGSGLSDSYVARQPKMVKPACDAVHAHYFE